MTSVLFAAGTLLHYVFGILMFVVAVFLILLVLVQRGRGGGLTGALGGMGGQSAFGTKAGDMFTRVTMATAGVWIILCMFSIWFLSSQDEWGSSGKTRPGGGSSATTTLPEKATTTLPEKEEPSGTTAPAPGGASTSPKTATSDAGGTGAGAGETKAASGAWFRSVAGRLAAASGSESKRIALCRSTRRSMALQSREISVDVRAQLHGSGEPCYKVGAPVSQFALIWLPCC